MPKLFTFLAPALCYEYRIETFFAPDSYAHWDFEPLSLSSLTYFFFSFSFSIRHTVAWLALIPLAAVIDTMRVR